MQPVKKMVARMVAKDFIRFLIFMLTPLRLAIKIGGNLNELRGGFMKNRAVFEMMKSQICEENFDDLSVEFLESICDEYTFRVVYWKGDVRTERQVTISNVFVSEEDF